jgi:transposase
VNGVGWHSRPDHLDHARARSRSSSAPQFHQTIVGEPSQSFLVGSSKTLTTAEPMILIEKLAEELPRNPSRFVLLGVGLSVNQRGTSMIHSPELESQIIGSSQVENLRVNTIAHRLGVHHTVVRRVLAQAGLLTLESGSRPSEISTYLPIIRQTLETFPTLTASRVYKKIIDRGYGGSPHYLRHIVACLRPQFDASEWMLALLQKRIDLENLKQQTDHLPGLEIFLDRLYNGRLSERNKSLAILANRRGLTIETICALLGISTSTFHSYKRLFLNGGSRSLFARKSYPNRRHGDETLKNAVFKVLHQPPSDYGINRTTWTMPLFRKVLSESGNGACPEVIRRITRTAGYRWRKARVVLTSADPAYSEKLTGW